MYKDINEINFINLLNNSTKNHEVTHTGKLRNIQKTEQSGSLRSLEVWGRFAWPVLGAPFVLLTEALDRNLPRDKSLRVVKTSEVVKVSIVNSSTFEIHTLNSIYRIEDIQKIFSDIYN